MSQIFDYLAQHTDGINSVGVISGILFALIAGVISLFVGAWKLYKRLKPGQSSPQLSF